MQESPKTTDKASDCVHADRPFDRPFDRSCVRIVTGSRLHFGLLDPATPFGGVGVMIQEPQTEVVVHFSESFRFSDPEADRIESIAARVAQMLGESQLPRCEVAISQRPLSHSGLGSGTQLSLALAESLACFFDVTVERERIVTEIAGRGQRSAVGSHGYFQGGLIYEEASESKTLNSIRARVEIPESWRVAVFRPTRLPALVCGDVEAEQFECLSPVTLHRRKEMRSIITDAMLPAARKGRFQEFAAAVHRYNHASGELFAEVQGGPYNGPDVTELVRWLVHEGALGVGQSSWGPGVFAWFESDDEWRAFQQRIPADITTIAATSARNQGRDCSIE
jgi:beta-RFAP synthase